jgi:hypothetical protein
MERRPDFQYLRALERVHLDSTVQGAQQRIVQKVLTVIGVKRVLIVLKALSQRLYAQQANTTLIRARKRAKGVPQVCSVPREIPQTA